MIPNAPRERLDQVLVARGLVHSRARAADLVRRGAVRVAGEVATKPGQLVAADAPLCVDAAANAYVARSGAKLVAALDAFQLDPSGRVALDIGASTGGFTQVLLERGARSVYAVDVGRDQLHPSLRADVRIVSLEGRDARSLAASDFAEPPQALVADVSFISLEQVLPGPLELVTRDGWLVALVKPQFEVGRAAVGKRGVVKEALAAEKAVQRVAALLEDKGWRVRGNIVSPLAGKEGNVEWLLAAVRS